MNMEYIETAIALIIAYLVGSLSSAIIVCKVFNLPDPRTKGSNNPGATNVLRIGGKFPAFCTLFGDALKGFIPVFLADLFIGNPFALGLIALAALFGHIYPIFFRFEGGKGVATTLGIIFALSINVGLLAVLTWFT